MIAVDWVQRAWTVFAHLSACLIVAVVFAFGLGKITSGNGAVIVIDQEPLKAKQKIPLGGQIAYDLFWHVAEGGCDQIVVARFTSKDKGKEGTLIEQRRRAQVRPVGKPGFDPIKRPLPPGITPGLWQYTVTIESACSTRNRIDPFVDFEIEVFDQRIPVVRQITLVVANRVVKPGGPLSYTYEFERTSDAPGEVITMFIKQDLDDPDIVIQRRPIVHSRSGYYSPIDISVDLPPTVGVGRWKMKQTLLTRFPDGHDQTDNTIEIDFEVKN